MTQKTVKFSSHEIELLISLASDQIFRREFIDPKMPGHRSKPEDVVLGKALVGRLKLALEQDEGKGSSSARKS